MKSRCFIALRFDTLKYRVFAFASSAKRPNVSFGSETDLDAPENEVGCALVNRHRQPEGSGPKSAIKRRDGLHEFSRSLFGAQPAPCCGQKKGLRIAAMRLSKSVERAV